MQTPPAKFPPCARFDGYVIELNFDPGIIVDMVDEEPEQTLGERATALLALGRHQQRRPTGVGRAGCDQRQ